MTPPIARSTFIIDVQSGSGPSASDHLIDLPVRGSGHNLKLLSSDCVDAIQSIPVGATIANLLRFLMAVVPGQSTKGTWIRCSSRNSKLLYVFLVSFLHPGRVPLYEACQSSRPLFLVVVRGAGATTLVMRSNGSRRAKKPIHYTSSSIIRGDTGDKWHRVVVSTEGME